MQSYEDGKKILFIHVPKTAGVSLIKSYEEYLADARHNPVLLYRLLLGKDFLKFTTFSVVRNPWARIFSAYHFLKKGGLSGTDPEMGKILSEECPSFEQFIKEWLPRHGVCSYGHYVPQYEFLCGWKRRVIVEHIIKVENLDHDWPMVAESLGLPVRSIGRHNTSNNYRYRESYDKESVEIVRKLYKSDVQLFGYSYEE